MPADDAPRVDPEALAWSGTIAAGCLTAICGGAALLGRWPLFVVVLLLQIAVTLAWLALTDIPATSSGLVIIVGAGVTADIYTARTGPTDQSWVAVVVAVAFVLATLRQLARRRRDHVSESLAGVMVGVMLAVFAVHLISTRALAGGVAAAAITCFAVAVATVIRRLLDRIAPRPGLRAGAGRGWLGLLLSVAAGAGVGAYIGSVRSGLDTQDGALIGLATATAAAVVDLGIGFGSAHLSDGRQRSAVLPLVVLAPLVVAAPVGYGVARLLAS